MKKIVSLILALALLMSLVSVAAVAEDGWVTLRVEAYDRSIAGLNIEDCWQLHYAQENFGDPNHIKLVFVPVSRWEEGDLLTTYMYGGTAPDLCLTYNGSLVNQAIQDEAIWQLDDLIAQYGTNLKAFIGDELMTYGQQDANGDGVKEQWYIPARRISVANVGNFIRKDWLDKLGMEKPTTVEEFEAYLRAAKEANLGGEHTYPMQFDLYEADPLINVKRFTDAWIDFSQVTEEDWFAYSACHEMLPGSKEGYRWLNKIYHEGLMYENFATGDDDMQDAALLNGYFGFFSMQPDQPWRVDKNYSLELEKVVPGASWVTVNCFDNKSLGGKHLHDLYQANGLSIIIPKTASEEVAIAAVKYMDWMAIPENMYMMQNGIEGINYESKNEDGLPIGVKNQDETPDDHKLHAGDICFISNGLYFGSDELNAAGLALAFDPKFKEDIIASYADAYSDAWTQSGFTVTIQASTDFDAMVKSKQGEFLTKVMEASAEDFDAVYDAAVQDILNVGAADIIAECRQAYLDGNYRGTFPGNN